MRAMLTALLALVLCCGCSEISGRPAKTDNPSASVQVLFTDSDGYTVKRFEDKGRFHYYVTPGPAKVAYEVQEGKSSSQLGTQTLAK
jgi:hypothetical protein